MSRFQYRDNAFSRRTLPDEEAAESTGLDEVHCGALADAEPLGEGAGREARLERREPAWRLRLLSKRDEALLIQWEVH